MTAINVMGAPAQNRFARLPTAAKAGKRKPAHPLITTTTPTGYIIHQHGIPVAWVYPGYHIGQSANQPKRCDFVDVAYHRQTDRGINLETRDFATLDEALAFVRSIFLGVVAA